MQIDAKEAMKNTKTQRAASSEPIHEWFSLSYASYLVVPRTILQSCSAENQQRLVDALNAIYAECCENMENQWPHEATINVKLKDCVTGRLVRDDLADYEGGRRRLWHNVEVGGPPPVTPESKQSANGGLAAPNC